MIMLLCRVLEVCSDHVAPLDLLVLPYVPVTLMARCCPIWLAVANGRLSFCRASLELMGLRVQKETW